MTIPPPDPKLVERFRADLAAVQDSSPDGEDLMAIAVSGGPDSLALLLLAAANGPIVAATVDHGLRPEAASEAHFVAGICARLAIPHAALTVQIADDGQGLQAAARHARYEALESWAVAAGATALATGHHADDQAETILMRLARGSGIAGLRGIRARRAMARGLPLVRPLLGWRRAELAAIVADAGLVAIDDPSNRNERFDRTRARALLAGGWPDAPRLAAVAAHMDTADAALGFSTQALWTDRARIEGPMIRLNADGLPREYRRRLLLLALEKLSEAKALRGDEVDRLLDRLASGQVSTLAGIRIDPGPPWRLTPAPPHRSF